MRVTVEAYVVQQIFGSEKIPASTTHFHYKTDSFLVEVMYIGATALAGRRSCVSGAHNRSKKKGWCAQTVCGEEGIQRPNGVRTR